MRVLLDTHAFLWWGDDDPHLSELAREIISEGNNEVIFSTASAWEIAIKASLGKLENIPEDLEEFFDEQLLVNGFEVLRINLDHAIGVRTLPYHHRDPFDRMLVAQAMNEDIPLLSVDHKLKDYEVRIIW